MPTKKGEPKPTNAPPYLELNAIATGHYLDALANVWGLTRFPGETDDALRTRLKNETEKLLNRHPQGTNS